MKKNKSVSAIRKVVETFENDPQKKIKELKRLVREGQKSGDLTTVGASC